MLLNELPGGAAALYNPYPAVSYIRVGGVFGRFVGVQQVGGFMFGQPLFNHF